MTPALLYAEWTKFRTVRGWVAGTVAAALMMMLVALLAGASSDQHGSPRVPIGPGGQPVTDSFYFVHRPLAENGSITVAVSQLTASGPGVVPWAKAGIVIKESTCQGSPYAAIMMTGGHGVRMQHDYVNDTAGSAGSPRWLRLDRSGDAITGYDSVDGVHWIKVRTVHVRGLGPTVQVGLFVASPPVPRGMGTVPTVSTATFENVRVRGGLGDRWTGDQVGAGSATFAGYPRATSGSFIESAGRVTVTGAGDMAPAVRDTLPTGGTLGDILTGTFAALIAVIVVGTLFITAEYRGKMIQLTFASTPGRARVLLGKAVVLGAVTFAAGLVGAAVAVPLGERLARSNGVYLFPVASSAELRVEIGTAALIATTSILALAVGTIFRSSAGAVVTVVAAVLLPYILVAQIPFMPAGLSDWLTRATPAAAFALQQTLERHHQVASVYTPYNGYYPLSPWAGFAVLAGYTAAAMALAVVLVRRRDA
jgi:ABC-type transport system involved in multi-copper enzyme maturation permease subunit